MIQSWYRKLVGPALPASRGERRRGGPRRASFRPQLEALEDRRLLSAGSLDPGFGTGGTAIIPFPGPFGPSAASANAIAVQGDKTVLAGSDFNVSDSFGDFAVARLNADGSLDQSFGTGGERTISFGPTTQAIANAVAVQGNKIIVAGFSADFNTGQQVMALARLNRDGSLDTSFGNGGEVTIPFNGADSAQGVAIQGNRIVVAGSTFFTNNHNQTIEDVAVARLNRDGSLDTSFGNGGETTFAFGTGPFSTTSAVAVQGDRILVAGGGNTGGNTEFAVARLNRDGSLDASFGTGGESLFEVGNGGPATSMALQGDKIVLAGTVGSTNPNIIAQFGVARLNPDGTLDTTFGTGGQVTFTFGNVNGEEDFANAVAVEGDQIVVAGFTQTPATNSDLAVARLNGDGSLDSTFGTGGEVTTDFPGDSAFGGGVAIQGNDIVVAGGLLTSTGENDFLAAAYLTS